MSLDRVMTWGVSVETSVKLIMIQFVKEAFKSLGVK